MAVIAFRLSRGSFDQPLTNVLLWGPALAAAVAAMVVALRGPAAVAWLAVGYIAWAATLGAMNVLQWVLAGLALALMPVLPRPRGSLPLGLAIAALVVVGMYALAPLARV